MDWLMNWLMYGLYYYIIGWLIRRIVHFERLVHFSELKSDHVESTNMVLRFLWISIPAWLYLLSFSSLLVPLALSTFPPLQLVRSKLLQWLCKPTKVMPTAFQPLRRLTASWSTASQQLYQKLHHALVEHELSVQQRLLLRWPSRVLPNRFPGCLSHQRASSTPGLCSCRKLLEPFPCQRFYLFIYLFYLLIILLCNANLTIALE